ncbi:hypothetical protein QLX08_002103 [Tetragonisca angustula]|uniref:Uncharacterized protein n=1 Tax=Tetragonisca angustula TaxID=166442 RepID=A0AAW1AFR3_9HYME
MKNSEKSQAFRSFAQQLRMRPAGIRGKRAPGRRGPRIRGAGGERSGRRLEKVQPPGRQIKFSLRLHGARGPLLLFICKARLNYGGGKEADGSRGQFVAIVVLADRKHHCTSSVVSG